MKRLVGKNENDEPEINYTDDAFIEIDSNAKMWDKYSKD